VNQRVLLDQNLTLVSAHNLSYFIFFDFFIIIILDTLSTLAFDRAAFINEALNTRVDVNEALIPDSWSQLTGWTEASLSDEALGCFTDL
jgi:hypothetical protein